MTDNITVRVTFVIVMFYGKSKPSNLFQYLSNFCDEFLENQKTDLEFRQCILKLKISSFACDALARSFFKKY